MFRSARIKLTAWYLLIIMLISISFSVTIYNTLSSELDRVERIQRLRIQHNIFGFDQPIPNPIIIDPDIITEAKGRVLIFLSGINLIILGSSALAGFFLAGRTLKPIKDMVDDQNQFITNASHELRTPLTTLRSEIEVNLRNHKLTLNEAKKILQSNLEEVNNLQVLSDGLIKMTQYQKGQNSIPLNDISLLDISADAVKKTLKIAAQKHIIIANRIHDEHIDGNDQMLTELLVIFLDNAIKYSPENTQIELNTLKIDGHIQISIKDQGVGIYEADLPHIFNRFYRADKSRTKTNTNGYGLGLSIAKQIVDRHKGTITVKSSIGTGTEFTITLPIKQQNRVL
jgi:two-component system, OmpR family, sensor histidine kinase CiaH